MGGRLVNGRPPFPLMTTTNSDDGIQDDQVEGDGPVPPKRVTNKDLWGVLVAVNDRFGALDARLDGLAERMDTLATNQDQLKETTNDTLHEMLGKLEKLEKRVTTLEFPWRIIGTSVNWGTQNWHFVFAACALVLGMTLAIVGPHPF